MASDLESLIEFGFPEYKAKKALKMTGNSGLQAALDWLEANGDNEEAFLEDSSDSKKAEKKKETCLMCNECKKRFKSLEQAELHAARTLHDDFVESIWDEGSSDNCKEEAETEVVVLTEEQKAARLAELRAKVAEKKAAREKEAREAEVLRKASTKEMEQVRREMQAKEMKKLAEERRLEKIEDKKRREEIKRQIEEDRENKKRQIEAEKVKAAGISNSNLCDSVTVDVPIPSATANNLSASSARIQIKLPPPNQPLKLVIESPNTFTLKDLKERIKTECPTLKNVNELIQTFPTRIFSKDEDGMSLNELGLSPSATLTLK